MSQALPQKVLDYIQSFNTGRHNPAYMKLDENGRVVSCGGHLERFGITMPEPGVPAGDTAIYLEGLLPLKTPGIILPGLETAPGVFADIHLFKENHAFTWVLFLDTSEHERKLRSILQKTNELQLKESRYRKLLESNISAQVLKHLNIGLFRQTENGRYEIVGELPSWFDSSFDQCDMIHENGHPQPDRCFPYLEYFLHYEAAKIWRAVDEESGGQDDQIVTSDLWIETDTGNKEYYLEASAIKIKNQNLLMIRRVDEDHSHFHFHIQKGREKSLAYERLQKSERFLKSFMANMSHELRTPMNSIMGISKMFNEYYAENLTEKQREGLQLIYRSGRRLLVIINNLLDLSKIEAGKLDVVSEPLVLNEMLREQEQMSLALIKDKSKEIRFRLKIARGMPRRIVADGDKLRRVLVNLLGNAVKFTNQGEIRLSTYMHGDHLYFSVKDTGIGIESEHLTDIFESFVQVNGSMTREHGGTGLGLSLSKNLVKLMGGNISVNSEKGKGSVFSFFIPLVIAEDGEK